MAEEDHRFKVMGVGKHIDRLDGDDRQTLTDQFGQIAAEGGWVAGNINDFFSAEPGKQGSKAWDTGPGRVDDQAVITAARRHQFGTAVVDGLLAKFDIGQTGGQTVAAGAANGRSLAFDAEDLAGLAGKGNSEVTHTAEQIKNRCGRAEIGPGLDQGDKLLVLGQINLTEAADFPAEGEGRGRLISGCADHVQEMVGWALGRCGVGQIEGEISPFKEDAFQLRQGGADLPGQGEIGWAGGGAGDEKGRRPCHCRD